MTCKDVRELLSPYLDNVLKPNEEDLVKKHLQACPHCREEYLLLKEVSGMLSELPELEAPTDFSSNIRKRLEKEVHSKRKVVPLFKKTWVRYALPAAAIFLLLGISMPGKLVNGSLVALKNFIDPSNSTNIEEPMTKDPITHLAAKDSTNADKAVSGGDTVADNFDGQREEINRDADSSDLEKPAVKNNGESIPDNKDNNINQDTSDTSNQDVVINNPEMGVASPDRTENNDLSYSITSAQVKHIAYYAVVQLSVNNVDEAFKSVIDITAKNGGSIKTNTADKENSKTIQSRIPVNNLTSYIEGVTALGQEKYKEIAEDDLTDEYTQTQKKLNELINLEQSLREDLSNAKSESQANQTEKELNSTKEKIKDLQNRLRNINNEAGKAIVVIKLNK